MPWFWEQDYTLQNIESLTRDVARDVRTLLKRMERAMATFDEVLAEVTAQGSRLDSLDALIEGLRKQVADAVSGQLTPEQQKAVDDIFAAAKENTARIDKAFDDNVEEPTP